MSRSDLALDAGLLEHLLHRDLGRRVADVGPTRRVQPHARVGPLHEQDLARVVADDGADGDLGRDVAGHALADSVEPLLEEVARLAPDLEVFLGRGTDVGRDLQHLLEPLPLVQALREAEAGARDARERFTPTQQLEREVLGSRGSRGAV